MKILNRKALHNYHIVESLEAGIVLNGMEVKSIRGGRIELGQSFAKILNGEVFLVNANIPAYQNSVIEEYDPSRTRKLLLHKDQVKSLVGKLSVAKVALVPVSVYVKNNLIKVQLGVAKSKQEFDKRAAIKEKDHMRRVEQELRGKE